MNFDLVERLALSLSARLWMNLAISYYTEGMDVVEIYGMTQYILHDQEKYTAIDWIVACHKQVQMRLSEHASSLEV